MTTTQKTTDPVAHVTAGTLLFVTAALGALLVGGCATPNQTVGLAAAGVILAGAQAPTHEVEQIYYLGAFDPEEQLPPTIYRVTVRGQSSYLNATRFASGWVPARVIDSLGGHLSADANANEAVNIKAAGEHESVLKVGRRLVMFGPEGFREAPADHRLVIVMGADPSRFFDAVDQTLGDISSVRTEGSNVAIRERLFASYQTIRSARESLRQLQLEVADELPKQIVLASPGSVPHASQTLVTNSASAVTTALATNSFRAATTNSATSSSTNSVQPSPQ